MAIDMGLFPPMVDAANYPFRPLPVHEHRKVLLGCAGRARSG